MDKAKREQTIISIVKDWRDQREQGTVLFSTHLLMRYWENRLLEALGWLGGVNLSLFGGLVESLTNFQSLGRSLSGSDQEFLVWGLARSSQLATNSNSLTQAGMSRAVSRLFREFKLAEVTPDDLEHEGVAINHEIKEMFRGYHSILDQVGKADLEDAYWEGLKLLKGPQGVPVHLQRVLVVGFQEFTGVQREILSFLKTQGQVVILEESSITDILTSRGNQTVLQGLLAEDNLSITGFTGSDREWEVRGLAREIRTRMAAGRAPAEMAVVFRNTEVYLPLVQKVFLEFEIPVEREPMPAWTSLPKLSSFFLYLKALTSDGDWRDMNRLFTHYFPGFHGRAMDGWLREDFNENGAWPVSIEQWAKWLEQRSFTGEPLLAEAMLGLAHLMRLDSPAALGDFWRVARAFFALPDLNTDQSVERAEHPWFQKALRVRRMQASAFEAWNNWEELTNKVGWQSLTLTIDDFLKLIELLFSGYRTPEYRRPGEGVVLTNPAELKGTRFPVIFLCGLMEGDFPRTPSRSGLVAPESLTKLRQLGFSLKTPDEFFQGERENFYQLVKAATEELVFSCPVGDTGGRPQPLSVFLREIRATLEQPIWPQYSSVRRFQLSPVSKKELQFNRTFHTPTKSESGIVEQRRRQGAARYTGFIGENSIIKARLAGRFDPDYSFSISSLEEYARCPFVFYCRKVLGVEPLNTPTLMAEPIELGIASHEILRAFLAEYAGNALQKGDGELYRQKIDQLIAQHFPATDSEEADGDRAILRRMQREVLRRTLRHFLADELDWQEKIRQSYIPRYFELEFGSKQEKGLILGDGATQVRLVGKIDRLDFRFDGKTFIIFDYKSNRVPTRSEMEKGRDLQIPLYCLAAEAKFPTSESMGGGYYSLSKRERTTGLWRKSWADETGVRIYRPIVDDEWQARLQMTVDFILQYAAGIRDGDFRLTRDDCRNGCMYRSVCRRMFSGGIAHEDE